MNAGGTTFTPGSAYSYKVATGAGDQSAVNITNPSQFAFASTAGYTGTNDSLTGDGGGNLFLNFTASAVPEPAMLLGLAAVAGIARRRRRK